MKNRDTDPTAKRILATPMPEKKIDLSNVEIEPLFKEDVDFETFAKSDYRAVKILNCEEVEGSKKYWNLH